MFLGSFMEKKALNLQKIARKGFSVVLVSLRCPEKHIKSPPP